MIDLNDPATVCRAIGYFGEYLITILPIIAIAWVAYRITR